jgi:hypothetical protein
MIEVGKALVVGRLSTEWELTSLGTLRSTSGLQDRVQRVRSYLSLEYNIFLELLVCFVALVSEVL